MGQQGYTTSAPGIRRWFLWYSVVMIAVLIMAACSDASGSSDTSEGEETSTLKISGIPDQNVSDVNRQHEVLADYIAEETGLEVEYVPMVDYAALVTAFERGEVHLAWFGGLTGVQARARVDGSEAIAHRPRDAEFHSEFIVQADLPVESLEDLKGRSFTFGSESSTSGHLMPRYYLQEAGINPDEAFSGPPNYSGSHDSTIELVQSGAFEAGAVNEAVWEQWVEEARIDPERVRVFYTTPAYFDYNWTIRGDVDEQFGDGATDDIKQSLLEIGPDQQEILDMFQAEGFVETNNENYQAIENVARELEMIR